MPSEGRVIVTTTTFYGDPDGKDKVRVNLACELVELAGQNGHIVAIVDGSPVSSAKERLEKRGAHVVLQSEKGMGPARRQVWKYAQNFVTSDVAGILWTEPEKPDIVRSIGALVSCMNEQGAHVVIPARDAGSWETYPAFQRQSEQTANLVYNKLFAGSGAPFDPMFGPVCFRPRVLPLFAEFYPADWGLPDTYVQHFAPVSLRPRGFKVVSKSVDFVYPPAQRAEEETALAPEMMGKRLWQLKDLVAAYFIMQKRFNFKL